METLYQARVRTPVVLDLIWKTGSTLPVNQTHLTGRSKHSIPGEQAMPLWRGEMRVAGRNYLRHIVIPEIKYRAQQTWPLFNRMARVGIVSQRRIIWKWLPFTSTTARSLPMENYRS